MALVFQCTHCSESIAVRFLKIGDISRCRKCGEEVAVPNDAQEAEVEIEIGSSVPLPESLREPEAKSSSPSTEMQVFQVAGIGFNAIYLMVAAIGLSEELPSSEEWLPESLPIIMCLLTIYALKSLNRKIMGMATAANIFIGLLLGFVGIVFNIEPDADLGGFILITLGLVSLTSLALTNENSWVSLYLKRRRLEEKVRIARLEKESSES